MPDPVMPTTQVQEIAARLAQMKPMRRGSVSERRVKCGKPGCPCAARADARHGPYFSLTRSVGGRTRSRFLDGRQAGVVREQIEAGRRFRAEVEAAWDACERWADAELESTGAASQEAAKKGASKKPSRGK
jgi:hypothetical protein